MKGKSILQQPTSKRQTENTITIKINKPPPYTTQNHNTSIPFNRGHLPSMIRQEIKQIKTRIEKSSKILAQSRKQKHSPSKNVPSDFIPLRFNYQSAKTYQNNFDLYRLEERDSEDSGQDSSQGTIQLPVHLEPEQQKYMNNGHIFEYKRQFVTEKSPSNYKTDRALYLNQFTKSLEKIDINKSVETIKTARNNSNNDAFYKNLFKTQRIEPPKRQKPKYNINQSFINRSKQKSLPKKKIEKPQNGKIKIKLNNPNKTARNRTKTQVACYSTRPRYHIEFPQCEENVLKQSVENKKECHTNKNDWQRLKEELQRYEFVRKYFSESDLYQIYEYLKKNHISQQRWPIFVVDEAMKKMNMKQQ